MILFGSCRNVTVFLDSHKYYIKSIDKSPATRLIHDISLTGDWIAYRGSNTWAFLLTSKAKAWSKEASIRYATTMKIKLASGPAPTTDLVSTRCNQNTLSFCCLHGLVGA